MQKINSCERAYCSKYAFEEEIKVGIWTARIQPEKMGWIMPDNSFVHNPKEVKRKLASWKTKS